MNTKSEHQATKYTLSVLWGIVTIPPLLFLLAWLTRGVLKDVFTPIDIAVTDKLRQWSSPLVTDIVTAITHLASSHIIIPLAVLLAALFAFVWNHRMDAYALILSLGGSYILNETMKQIFERTRPAWEHWVLADGYSFPSGHAMVGASFYAMLAYLIVHLLRDKGIHSNFITAGISCIASLIIICIALSRVYLGVHYITDIVAGMIAGMLWFFVCIYALRWVQR